MNESVCYDWAADFYDSSRDFPEPIATHGLQAMLDLAGPGARILDVGTGTGRFSVPLMERGADLIGCDLSAGMMARLRRKRPSARLVQADAARLPFRKGGFDAVFTSHVMHLVGPWREALDEYRRVLKPGGLYLNARTENTGGTLRRRLRDHWQGCLLAHGASGDRPGIRSDRELTEELARMGADVRRVEVVRFPRTSTLGQAIEAIAGRTHSNTRNIPDEIFEACVRDLREWAGRELGGPETPIEGEACFVLDVARFEDGA